MEYYKAQAQTHCSTANMGPGFDNAGGAFRDLFLIANAEITPKRGLDIEFTGKYKFPTNERSRPRKVYDAMVAKFGERIDGGMKLSFRNDIKDGGLGTSGANCVAPVVFLNHFYGLGLTPQQIAEYAAIGEPGHSDNVSACVMKLVFTKEYKEAPLPNDFEPHPIPNNIVPGVVIPLDIVKEGGTAQARALKVKLTEEELIFRNSLYGQLVRGFDTDDFEAVRDAIKRYSHWEKSVTYIRNAHGIYKRDVLKLMIELERIVGTDAIVTPSGAGPVQLVLAKNPDAADRAIKHIAGDYREAGHTVESIVTSFHDSRPRILD